MTVTNQPAIHSGLGQKATKKQDEGHRYTEKVWSNISTVNSELYKQGQRTILFYYP